MDNIRIFAPATVANVSCGFDAMAFALDNLGDEMVFKKTAAQSVCISKIEGAKLPFDPHKNAAGVVAALMLEESKANFGVDIEIFKKFKPGSGLGSSAASAAGSAFAVNALLGKPYSNLDLVKFAMQGEVAACGSAIADNVAACIYGGFVLIRSYEPLDIIAIPSPNQLRVSIIHPQIEIKTEDARKLIPEDLPLKTAIAQWANVGGLISGLYESNYKTIANSLVDLVAEPYRKQGIPHFDELKTASIEAGALGIGISGSGPAVFALSKGEDSSKEVVKGMNSIYKNTGIDYNIHQSQIGKKGVRVL
jgi:homoserine kinase